MSAEVALYNHLSAGAKSRAGQPKAFGFHSKVVKESRSNPLQSDILTK